MDLELKFEWDDDKDIINQMRHGVSFEEATEVFYDPRRLELYDRKHSLFEDRWIARGLSGCNVLIVIFTERRGGVIRIISAREADKEEEEEYFKWLW